MHKQKGAGTSEFIAGLCLLLIVGGWIANVVKIVSTIDNVVTGLFIARCIGVFVAPLGAVLGYF